jgi:hypothetical protein
VNGVRVVVRTLTYMTDDERRILLFERDHPENDRTKEATIRATFGFSWVRYRQILLRVIGDPTAVEEFPAVVRRVTDQTAGQMAARRDRRFA